MQKNKGTKDKMDRKEKNPTPSRRLERSVRWGLTGLLLANVAAALFYRGLVLNHLEQTSALFIGLPLGLGLMLIQLTEVRSTVGAVLRGNLIFFCIVAPLLGEGSVCLLMAAPIFIAVSLVVVAARNRANPSAAWLLLLILPVVMGAYEREANLRGDGIVTVSSRILRPGAVADWVTRTQKAAVPAPSQSRFLNIGFPVPESYRIEKGQATVQFSLSEGVRGAWKARVSPLADGAHFDVLSDDSKLIHWVKFIDSDVHVSEASPGMVQIEQTTRFQPLLHPLWYFVPAERFAVGQAHIIAADTWAAAR
jgi:hypothetical protein